MTPSLVTASAPPPFLLDEAKKEVALKVVFFGADPKQLEHEFKTVSDSWPNDSKTQMQTISAANVPEAGATFIIQHLLPPLQSINGHRVRLDVFASTAAITGPYSAGQAVTLMQAACVIVLPGSAEKTVVALNALLAKVERTPARPPVVVFIGEKPKSAPETWLTTVAPSVATAVDTGVRKVADLIK